SAPTDERADTTQTPRRARPSSQSGTAKGLSGGGAAVFSSGGVQVLGRQNPLAGEQATGRGCRLVGSGVGGERSRNTPRQAEVARWGEVVGGIRALPGGPQGIVRAAWSARSAEERSDHGQTVSLPPTT